jgi:hypothetical protein
VTQPTTINLPDYQIGDTVIVDRIEVRLIAQPMSSGYTPRARQHTCPLGPDCRFFDIESIDPRDEVRASAWDCQMSPTLTEGQHLQAAAGTQDVRLTCIRVGAAYTVETGHTNSLGQFVSAEIAAQFDTETAARAYARTLTVGLREIARVTEPAPGPFASRPTPQARPAAPGTRTRVTDPQTILIRQAGVGGHIARRRNGTGEATTTQLRAMAKRGFVSLTTKTVGRRTIITGGIVTPAGNHAAQAA